HSLISDPGDFTRYYCLFPENIGILRDFVSQQFLHYADFHLFDVSVPSNRFYEMNARYMTDILGYLFHADFPTILAPKKRKLGICRDGALLFCSIMRNRGIPARLRCGFVTYYQSQFYLDGFCLEYYDCSSEKWRHVDVR